MPLTNPLRKCSLGGKEKGEKEKTPKKRTKTQREKRKQLTVSQKPDKSGAGGQEEVYSSINVLGNKEGQNKGVKM
jgi:hypothetical protein